MMAFRCLACHDGWVVRADPALDPHLELCLEMQFSEPLVCPSCGGNETALAFQGDYRSDKELSSSELYRAVMGLGLPEERNCTKEAMEELLRGNPVRRIIGQTIPNTTRVNVEALELWDGTRVYFAPEGLGVTIFRIAHPGKALERMLKE